MGENMTDPVPLAATNETTGQRSQGPIGAGDYVVKQGECLDSIAFAHGFLRDTLWNDAANAEIKSVRTDPNVLLQGDRLTIPNLRGKEETGATKKRHLFNRKGTPIKLRLQLLGEKDKPRSKEPYLLEIDGVFSIKGAKIGRAHV